MRLIEKVTIVMSAFLVVASATQARANVEAGSTVTVNVMGSVSSESQTGFANQNAFIVASDVSDRNGHVVIKAGTPVQAEINAKPRRRVGKPGLVEVTLASTHDTAGQFVRLSSPTYRFEGKSKRGLALGVGIGVGLLAWPVMLTMMMKGGAAQVPPGQQLNATVVP